MAGTTESPLALRNVAVRRDRTKHQPAAGAGRRAGL